jgi:hypothetical protein
LVLDRIELIFKNGDTQGYARFIGFSPRRRQGVVLPANGEFSRPWGGRRNTRPQDDSEKLRPTAAQ